MILTISFGNDRTSNPQDHRMCMVDLENRVTYPFPGEDQVVPHSLEPKDTHILEGPIPLYLLISEKEPFEEEDSLETTEEPTRSS